MRSLHLVKIAEASSGIAAIDALRGQTCLIVARGTDSDLEPWLEVWVERRRVLVYERDLELIALP